MGKSGPAEGVPGRAVPPAARGTRGRREPAVFYWRCQTRVRLALAPLGPVRVTVQAGLAGS